MADSTASRSDLSQRLYAPALGGIYSSLDRYVEPLLRLGLAAILIPKGLQKVFGLLGGAGLGGTAELFDNLGYSPGVFWGTLVAFTELFGGILLLIGLFVRPAALAVVIFMLAALQFTWSRAGWFWLDGGAEFSWLILITALVLLIRGSGALSVDKRLSKEF